MKLKKYKLIIMALFTALFTFSSYAEGKYNPASDFKYEKMESKTGIYEIYSYIIITGYIGKNPIVNIPELIEGLPVTKICEDAFRGNNLIKTVSIPSSVNEIRNRAFRDCESLTEVYMSLASISDIGGGSEDDTNIYDDGAFCGCISLKSVVIESGINVSIHSDTFKSCRNLTTVTLPRKIDGGWSFYGCTKLKTINFRGTKTEWPFVDNKNYQEALKDGLIVNYNYIGE